MIQLQAQPTPRMWRLHDPDARAYANRVRSDGGVVVDPRRPHALTNYAKGHGAWPHVLQWIDRQSGVKLDGSLKQSTWYDLKSAADYNQPDGMLQGTWTEQGIFCSAADMTGIYRSIIPGFRTLESVWIIDVVKTFKQPLPDSDPVGNIFRFGDNDPARGAISFGGGTGSLSGEMIALAHNPPGAATRRLGVNSAQVTWEQGDGLTMALRLSTTGTTLRINGAVRTWNLANGMTASTNSSPSACNADNDEVRINGQLNDGVLDPRFGLTGWIIARIILAGAAPLSTIQALEALYL